jgi:hypothetical protein
MASDAELILLFAALHVVGLAVLTALLVLFLRSDTARAWSPPDEGDDGGGGGNDRLGPRAPSGPDGGGLPLPDAAPARFRLRDHTRLRDLLPRPPRRPSREPERSPVSSPPRGRSGG